MKYNRKEAKRKARQSVKKHYFLFVIMLLITAFLGIAYNSAWSILDLKDINFDETKEEGHVVVEEAKTDISSASDKVIDVIYDYIDGKVDDAKKIENGVNATAANRPDVALGAVTVSYRKGILASVVNSLESGMYFATIFSSILAVVKSPTIASILLVIGNLLVLILIYVVIKNAFWITVKRTFVLGQTYSKIYSRNLQFLFKTKCVFRSAFTLLIKDVVVLLWGLTIVGLPIMYFAYYMVPFIVAENPQISARAALKLSRKMMKGHKWECFVQLLSFILWEILNICTVGLLGVFFLNPYIEASFAQFYLCMRRNAIDNKIEGYEAFVDKYIDTFPSAEEVTTAYAEFEELKANQLEKPIKYGKIGEFFSNIFGIVPFYNKKARDVNRYDEEQYFLKGYNDLTQFNTYADRLHPCNKIRSRKQKSANYLRRYSITSIITIFFSGCMIGWIYEVMIHIVEDGVFVNRGVMHGPWLPIYGTGAVVILLVLYRFRKWPWLEFILAIILSGIVEYTTSWVMEMTHNGQRWWDYHGYFLNINGRVCAEGLLVFGIAGMACVYFLAPLIDNVVSKFELKIFLPVVTVLSICFIGDFIYSRQHPNTGKGITDYDVNASVNLEVNDVTYFKMLDDDIHFHG